MKGAYGIILPQAVVVGVPGAFTPTCSGTHVPGYLAKQAALKAKGVSEVIVCSVNDGAVMEGWAKDQKVEGSMITFLGDTRMELTKALDLVLDAEKPMEVLGNPRCKRFAMVVDNGIIKASRKFLSLCFHGCSRIFRAALLGVQVSMACL